MRLFFKKLKSVICVLAVAAAMLCSACFASAGLIKGFNKAEIYSFSADTENTFSKPAGTVVSSGSLSWKLYDNYESRLNKDGLYIGEGYIQLKAGNPLNTLADFRMEVAYSSAAAEGDADGTKPFLLTSTKKYTLTQLMADSGTVLGIAENGDIYYKGQKINHADGDKTADILTARNPQINPGDECKITIDYVNGKLTVRLTYASGKTTVKLVDNYQCEISGLQQLMLGGDKSKRLDKVTYKSVSVSEYGEYVPTGSGIGAIVQSGESVKEYGSADMALTEALNQSGKGNNPVLMLYSDITLRKPITVDAGRKLTVDLNGHTINRNCHSTMVGDGYVFLVGEGALLTIADSSPDAQNYSSAIRGGVITGGAGDDNGGGIHMKKNSKFIMNGGSIVGCITNDHGGAIRVDDSGVSINISNAGFYSNMTLDSSDNSHGGAIYSDYSSCNVTVKNSIFEGNYSEDCGGAVYINDGSFSAENCLFSGNKCLDDGGAVYIESGSKASFEHCTFINNRSDGHAGAVYCNSSEGTRLSGTFRDNSAGEAGGALFINGDTVSVQDAEITGNTAGDRGGAMYVDEMYDINIQGLLKVRNNYKTDKSRDDIFLDSIGVASAKIYDGGLYDGSEVWVLTSDSSQTVSEYISEYQQRFFYSDDSSKSFSFSADSSKTLKQALITSAVGNGKVMFIIASAAVIIVIAAVIGILKAKKKGADRNEKKA